ncbi:hypothetical protein [Streptomyces sp. NPDC001292]|uniref:hypothetical protein n=1 Tax=Streptomyces sp. NPDC001292 TaxID=3364558 RepID=UPI0036C5F0B2
MIASAGAGHTSLDADLDGSADRLLGPLLSDFERDDVCLLVCHIGSAAGEEPDRIPADAGHLR